MGRPRLVLRGRRVPRGRATVGTNTPSRRESVGGLVKLPGLSSMLRLWVRSASEPTAGQAVTAISGCRRHSGSIQIKCRSLAGIRSATVRILHPSGVFQEQSFLQATSARSIDFSRMGGQGRVWSSRRLVDASRPKMANAHEPPTALSPSTSRRRAS